MGKESKLSYYSWIWNYFPFHPHGFKKFTSISNKMVPSGWEVRVYVEKLEVGWQQVVALFSIRTTGAYGTKRAKSVGCPH